MERQYKRSFKAYAAWNYQEEIEDLNRESDIQVYLKKDVYTICFSDYPGGKLNIHHIGMAVSLL